MSRHQFIIKKVSDGWIVCVQDREEHGHFRTRAGCQKLVGILAKGHMPKNDYFIEAARRILTIDEFCKLINHNKPKYININKGVAR